MYILVTYDVSLVEGNGAARLRRVAKICRDYGQRVQNSVFECLVTESQYILLKNAISKVIDKNEDSVRFYILGSEKKRKVDTLGKYNYIDLRGDLIV